MAKATGYSDRAVNIAARGIIKSIQDERRGYLRLGFENFLKNLNKKALLKSLPYLRSVIDLIRGSISRRRETLKRF